MENFDFWWYIIAAIIYFVSRGRKKKQAQSRPAKPQTNEPASRPKSFEDLLKEITEGRIEDDDVTQEETFEKKRETSLDESIRQEGTRRSFADDESRKIYEESIKMAEGSDLSFERNEHFRTKLERAEDLVEEENALLDEIRDGLSAADARKAIVYSEILNRRF